MPRIIVFLIAAIIALAPPTLFAQDKEPDHAPKATEPAPNRPLYVSPSARLAAAKTAIVVNIGGSDVPYNIISNGIEGWGRYRLVDSRAEADIVVEVRSPDDDNASSASSSSKTHVGGSGRMQESSAAPRDVYNGPIKLVVTDAKTHIVLWAASEQPKGGFRQRVRDDHMVEAASHLLTKFHERIEPPPPAPK